MKKQIFCICMAVFFAIGILGNVCQADGLLRYADTMEAQGTPGMQEAIKSVSLLQKIDDFQIISSAGRINNTILEGLRRTAQAFLAAAVILFFGILSLERRLHFSEKGILIFFVVSFIHRSDGKKKACFG